MRVRVFNTNEGVKVLVPTYYDALEKDTNRFFQGVPYFDCDNSELPLRRDSHTNECFRCSWLCDMVNKKVIVNKPCTCIHNDLMKLDKILDDPLTTRQVKLEAMLDKELLARKQKVK